MGKFLLRFPMFRSLWFESLEPYFAERGAGVPAKSITTTILKGLMLFLISTLVIAFYFITITAMWGLNLHTFSLILFLITMTFLLLGKKIKTRAMDSLISIFGNLLAATLLILLPVVLWGWSAKTIYLLLFIVPILIYLKSVEIPFLMKLRAISYFMMAWLILGFFVSYPVALVEAKTIKENYIQNIQNDWDQEYPNGVPLSKTRPHVFKLESNGRTYFNCVTFAYWTPDQDKLRAKYEPQDSKGITTRVAFGKEMAKDLLYEYSEEKSRASDVMRRHCDLLFPLSYIGLWLIAIGLYVFSLLHRE